MTTPRVAPGARADAEAVLALAKAYPQAQAGLVLRQPWWVLVAGILWHGVPVERLNQILAVLAERCAGPSEVAVLAPRDLARSLMRLPRPLLRARNLTEAARHVARRLAGVVPRELSLLLRIPGVDRHCAMLVQAEAFAEPGMPLDRAGHGLRVALRLGWIEVARLGQLEEALRARIVPADWPRIGHRLAALGRDHCRPLRPWCSRCPLAGWCLRQGVVESR